MGNKGRRPQPQNTDQVALYITVGEDLKEAAREAREATKDLAAERKRVEELLARLPKITEAAIGDNVRGEVAKLEKVTLEAMDKAVIRVNSKFDELADSLRGQSRQQRHRGDPSLQDLVRTLVGLPEGVPIEVTVESEIRPTNGKG